MKLPTTKQEVKELIMGVTPHVDSVRIYKDGKILIKYHRFKWKVEPDTHSPSQRVLKALEDVFGSKYVKTDVFHTKRLYTYQHLYIYEQLKHGLAGKAIVFTDKEMD